MNLDKITDFYFFYIIVTGEHAHEATNTHGKTTTHAHSDTRGISRKFNVHKQRIDKHDTTEHNKTDHSGIRKF